MFQYIIHFSIRNKFIVGLGVLLLVAAGLYSAQHIPLDAVPDITNNQVQIVTVSQSLAPQEVEQLITYPIEIAMANIPGVLEIRSISRFGLSVVTVVFKDGVPMLDARQYVREQIDLATAEIPAELGSPELMPITTGLGEIYQYTLQVAPEQLGQYDAMKLRTIQDWIVKRQLSGIPGVVEVSSFGGFLKQYEVAVDPLRLQSFGLTVADVFSALQTNNQNSGGSYIERKSNAYYIRTEGRVNSSSEMGEIVVATRQGIPVLVRDVAAVRLGAPPRFGAMTQDGKGEAVGGIVLMLKGANSSEVIDLVHQRVAEVQKSLPEGVSITPYLDRSVLIGKAIDTVSKNLIEGGLIVVFVLVLLLGNWRAGLIVASVIPLAMLFALTLMHLFGVSANLMSLGAIDFGIVVDGAVIIVESSLHFLFTTHVGKKLSQHEMDEVIETSTNRIYQSAAFGVLIILVVFLPIMTLEGIEGKMFRPMAQTVSFAIIGAMLLSLTYVPMISALFLKKDIREHHSFSDKIVDALRKLYRPSLLTALRLPYLVLGGSLAVLVGTVFIFSRMGGEFIPTLEEGDLAMQMAIQPGSSLQESIKTSTKAEQVLLANFPEVKSVVSKIGTAEVPTDPMAIEDADIMILLKEKSEWVSASSREELVQKMKEKLEAVPGASFEFTQPIQLRFNELITGAKTDIAIKIFGEDTEILASKAEEVATIVRQIQGAGDVKIEQTEGLQQLMISFDRQQIARYGLNIEELNTLVRSAYAGEKAGFVFEGERKFDVVIRLREENRSQLDLSRLYVRDFNGNLISMSQVATVTFSEGPMQVSRENTRRRINIGVNVRDRDVASLVTEIQQKLEAGIKLPPGYFIRYGGQFENLQNAQKRLGIAVPVALFMIFILLYFAFGSLKYALLIFTAVPLSAVGGVLALWLRGMPFSISAGVGFIALFGVAVLNGIVMISYLNQLKEEGNLSLIDLIENGALARLRPVVMTAMVAALGFLPMALSTSSGAEVQKPLATVVIGGLATATLLTLLVLPVLYLLANRKSYVVSAKAWLLPLIFCGSFLLPKESQAQNTSAVSEDYLIERALQEHPQMKQATLNVRMAQADKQGNALLGPLGVNYQRGQINASVRNDYNLNINQSFGNLPGYFSARKLADRAIEQQEAEKELTSRNLRFQVRHYFNDWLFFNHSLLQLTEQENLLGQAVESVGQQFAAGETDQSAVSVVKLALQNLRAKKLETMRLANQSGAALMELCWLESLPVFEQQPFMQLPVNQPAQASLSSSLLSPIEKQKSWQLQNISHQRNGYFPELSAGFFRQKVEGLDGLQGWQVGLSIPIGLRKPKAAVAKARLELEKTEQSLQWQQQKLSADLSESQLSLQQLAAQLATTTAVEPTLPGLLNQQLQAGAIRFSDFAFQMQTVFEAALQQLRLKYQYNQSALRWLYLTESITENRP